jgi:hypothetical protein
VSHDPAEITDDDMKSVDTHAEQMLLISTTYKQPQQFILKAVANFCRHLVRMCFHLQVAVGEITESTDQVAQNTVASHQKLDAAINNEENKEHAMHGIAAFLAVVHSTLSIDDSTYRSSFASPSWLESGVTTCTLEVQAILAGRRCEYQTDAGAIVHNMNEILKKFPDFVMEGMDDYVRHCAAHEALLTSHIADAEKLHAKIVSDSKAFMMTTLEVCPSAQAGS